MSGSTLPPDGKTRDVNIEVHHSHHNWTLEPAHVAKVELLRNGIVIRVWEPNSPEAKLSYTIKEDEACWYAVRAYGTDQRWQVALASPIYFANAKKLNKRAPLPVRVRGRIYDFVTGREQKATVTVTRHDKVLDTFEADGQFLVDMPLDATIAATRAGVEGPKHELLLGYGPVHRYLWKLDSEALGRPETLEQFETLVRNVALEFPLGHRMSGCYAATATHSDLVFKSLKVIEGPQVAHGTLSVATILLDKRRAQAGDVINIAALFHFSGGEQNSDGLLVVEGRAYDPRRPTGFNPLKVFDTFEAKWSQATNVGTNYRAIFGKLTVPKWVAPGSVDALEINAIARGKDGKFESHVAMRLPLGDAQHALMVSSNWPTIPVSWPDHNYGIGPLKVCGKIGRQQQPRADYRELHLKVSTADESFEVRPMHDCRGCADADDAVYTGHYFDQILNDESQLLRPLTVRPQPEVQWRPLEVRNALPREEYEQINPGNK